MVKICPKCKTEKPLTEFWKNRCTKDGLQPWCKDCWYIITTARRNGPKREVELRQRRNRHLIRKYGITVEAYEEMVKIQNGTCAICGETQFGRWDNLVVDHNHVTNQVRGLLCDRCNKTLGLMRENTDYIQSAIDYLKGWE